MNEEQLRTKVAYLVQENNRLREALLDAQIQAGVIRLDEDGESDG